MVNSTSAIVHTLQRRERWMAESNVIWNHSIETLSLKWKGLKYSDVLAAIIGSGIFFVILHDCRTVCQDFHL
jgi:hypothetical protein